MYTEHFGLNRALFDDGIARDAGVFLGPRQQLVAANLKIALTTRDSIAVLSGPSGVGKTTLALHSLRAATTRLAIGWLGSTPLTAHELLEQLLIEFEFSAYKNSRVERLQTWRQFLNEMSITDTRVCVLVENAHELEPEVLRALASLTGADPNGCPGANVVLTSPVALNNKLRVPGLEALKQRLRLSCRLEPLTAPELEAYLRHRVRLAGGDYARIFAPGVIAMLQHYSGGLIRVINNLTETALTVAATRKEAELGPQLLMRVAVGLFGMEPVRLPKGAAPGQPTATGQPAPARPAATEVSTAASEPAKAAAPQSLESTENRRRLVNDAALAAARMMADEARLAPEEPDAPSPAPAVPRPSAARAETAMRKPALPSEAAPDEPDEPDSRLDATAEEPMAAETAVSATAESEVETEQPEPTASERVLAVEPEVALDADSEAEPERDAARPPQTAPQAQATAEIPDIDASAVIEFSAHEPEGNPFEIDEEILADGVEEPAPDLDVPTLTDSVDTPDDEVSLAIQASSDEEDPATETDASLASTLAGYTDLQSDVQSEKTRRKQESKQALAHAKALEDISNSMAETLFGDAELEELSATLAVCSAAQDAHTESDDDDALELELDDEPEDNPKRGVL